MATIGPKNVVDKNLIYDGTNAQEVCDYIQQYFPYDEDEVEDTK